MSKYRQGRDFEYVVRDHFLELGWVVVRSAGSKTKADLVAMRGGLTLLIQCKRRTWPGPLERLEFAKICELAGHPGVLARSVDGHVQFRGITSDGQLEDGAWFAPGVAWQRHR